MVAPPKKALHAQISHQYPQWIPKPAPSNLPHLALPRGACKKPRIPSQRCRDRAAVCEVQQFKPCPLCGRQTSVTRSARVKAHETPPTPRQAIALFMLTSPFNSPRSSLDPKAKLEEKCPLAVSQSLCMKPDLGQHEYEEVRWLSLTVEVETIRAASENCRPSVIAIITKA